MCLFAQRCRLAQLGDVMLHAAQGGQLVGIADSGRQCRQDALGRPACGPGIRLEQRLDGAASACAPSACSLGERYNGLLA